MKTINKNQNKPVKSNDKNEQWRPLIIIRTNPLKSMIRMIDGWLQRQRCSLEPRGCTFDAAAFHWPFLSSILMGFVLLFLLLVLIVGYYYYSLAVAASLLQPAALRLHLRGCSLAGAASRLQLRGCSLEVAPMRLQPRRGECKAVIR